MSICDSSALKLEACYGKPISFLRAIWLEQSGPYVFSSVDCSRSEGSVIRHQWNSCQSLYTWVSSLEEHLHLPHIRWSMSGTFLPETHFSLFVSIIRITRSHHKVLLCSVRRRDVFVSTLANLFFSLFYMPLWMKIKTYYYFHYEPKN